MGLGKLLAVSGVSFIAGAALVCVAIKYELEINLLLDEVSDKIKKVERITVY